MPPSRIVHSAAAADGAHCPPSSVGCAREATWQGRYSPAYACWNWDNSSRGPFAAKTLADFGAQVVKIEPPGQGDLLRKWRLLHEGTSVWWEAQSRNKQSVCVDLRQPEGQDIVRQLAAEADVLIENFRPGTLEKWGLSWETLHALNPRLIMLRISGYGQTGPKAREPGFAAIGEAMAGLRYLNGEPGRAPVRAGLSLGDTIAGLHGALGVLLALYQRDARGGQGQVIDAALYESLFNLSESLLPEYSVFGAVREPAGASLPGIAPSNAYPCRDGYVLIAGNGDAIYTRLMARIGRDDLGRDPDLAHNDGRARRVAEIDQAIGAWTGERAIDEVLQAMREAPTCRRAASIRSPTSPTTRTIRRAAPSRAWRPPAASRWTCRRCFRACRPTPARCASARRRWASTPTRCWRRRG